jgi:PKHD-type hydroxylase
MKANWQMWEGYFSSEVCANIVSLAKNIPAKQAVIGFNDPKISQEVRRSKVRWIERHHQDLRWVMEETEHLIHTANRNAFGVDITKLFELQFTEYSGEDKGHYDWHNDVNWDDFKTTHRKLSVVVQLSSPTDYEGGAFEMQTLHLEPPKPEPLKKQGTVLVFPSFLQHKVNPVTSGTRHSLVGWMEGPKWR